MRCSMFFGLMIMITVVSRAPAAPVEPAGDEEKGKPGAPPAKEEVDKAEKAIQEAVEKAEKENLTREWATKNGLKFQSVSVSMKLIGDKPVLRAFPNHLFFDVHYTTKYKPTGSGEVWDCWAVPRKAGIPVELRQNPPNKAKANGVEAMEKFLAENLGACKDEASLKEGVRACQRIVRHVFVNPHFPAKFDDGTAHVKSEMEGKTASGKTVVRDHPDQIEIFITINVDAEGKPKKIKAEMVCKNLARPNG